MSWSYASSRLALTLRRWRGRFGIFAAQVAVQPRWPWYLRAAVIVAAFLLGAGWVLLFDPADHLSNMRHAEELAALQKTNAALLDEITSLRNQLTARENDLQIEQAAQRSLADKHKALIDENTRLKEELAVLQRLAAQSARKK